MSPSRALAATILLLHSAVTAYSVGTTYLLTVNSQPYGGSSEILCVQIYTCRPLHSLVVNLVHKQENKELLKEPLIHAKYQRCIHFQVPAVTQDTEASISLVIKGRFTHVNKTTKILIKPPALLTIIETDKPIYKPGQTVKFRIVSLDSNFLTFNQMFPKIEVKDPNSNRIGQWLNMTTFSGFLDLSYPISSEAPLGFYVITAWNERNEPITRDFEIKKYVLPKFEVTVVLPPVITILDTTVTLKVCGKYTYGKPVIGSVTAVVCRRSYRFVWFVRGPTQVQDICKTYIMNTDRTGCGSHAIDLRDYAMTSVQYQDVIEVDAKLEEFGTGVVQSGLGSTSITSDIVTLTFVDVSDVFKPDMTYEGNINATGPNSAPIRHEPVYLIVRYAENKNQTLTLTTDDNGVAHFSLDTHPWGSQPVTLEARYNREDDMLDRVGTVRRPTFPSAYLWLQPFYSKSKSFLELQTSLVDVCEKEAVVFGHYIVHGTALEPHQKALDFFYVVLSRGHSVQQGCVTVEMDPDKENRGKLSILLHHPRALAPVAQVVVFTLLPNGDVVADSMDYSIELTLKNKVSLELSTHEELPGQEVFLTLKAHPGSLCSVKAIDQSLLLLRPEMELSVQSVYHMLPVQELFGYPVGLEDEQPFVCNYGPRVIMPVAKTRALVPIVPIFYGKIDIYNVFKYVGMKILSNGNIRKHHECSGIHPMFATEEAVAPQLNAGQSQPKPAVRVRRFFPETWIWDLVLVGESGAMGVSKTVPDTITTWEGGAFCTSPVGFGVAPKVNLTAFQPFFVSLTLPYSVVRGEVFTLKATVFNYLPSCIMVKATLAPSQQFSAEPCWECVYTHCLCADESWTFRWIIKPSVLGKVKIKVTVEAIHSTVLCGKELPVLPKKGIIDAVEESLLVVAEGIEQRKTYNELICTKGSDVDRSVTLRLPDVFVEGSATASVTVLGDLMGHALQNLDNLLAMPYGCGEQNMISFAPDIFILEYLESSNQLTPAIRTKAIPFLLSGYQKELTYKHMDGSYSAFGMSDSSGNTWLTAFVMKSFENAKRYIFIDQAVVDQAKTWLGHEQLPNGCFASVGTLIHVDLQGGVNDNVTLSAYVTAALLEAGSQSTDPVLVKALDYLRNTYPQVNSIYAIALLAYTFTLAGDQAMRSTLLTRLDQQAIVTAAGRHWSSGIVGSVAGSLEVETTSYVLLAILSGPPLQPFDLGYSASIVRWLGQQQNAYGGFVSTQDTVVALQALAKYSAATYSPSGSITVIVTSPSGQTSQFTVDQSNRLLYQQVQLQDVTGSYKLRVTGHGCVFVQFTLHYNILPLHDHTSFNISTHTVANCKPPLPMLHVSVTVRYNGPRAETNMVVIEFTLLSGFSLNKVTDVTVKRVDQNDGQVILYLDGLKKGVPHTSTLDIQQDVVVQNLRPAAVKVYDYYQTSDKAVTEYTSPCR